MSTEVVIGVSLTVAATMISAYNTLLVVKQSRLIEKQALLQRSQVYPYVQIKEKQFKQNILKLTLENKAEASPAFQLGLLTAFVPLSGIKAEHWQFADEILFSDWEDITKGYPTRSVAPLKNEKASNRLYGKEQGSYAVEPLFLFKSSKKDDTLSGSCKYERFIDLKKRLTTQGINFVAVMFSVVYKDVAETLQEDVSVTDFVVDLRKHENLEQASKEGIEFHDKTISMEDVPCVEFELYTKLKSHRAFLEPTQY